MQISVPLLKAPPIVECDEKLAIILATSYYGELIRN